MSVLLKQLFPQVNSNVVVTELQLDSRHVKQGDLFFAFKGFQQDGRVYIGEALSKGAVAIAYDPENYQLAQTIQQQYPHVEFLAIASLQRQLSAIASCFYGEPAAGLQMIGVTGTNGKTSVSQLLAQALDLLGERCGIIGTLGNGFWQHLIDAKQTTPDAISVQASLALLKEQGASSVSMEVSSHGLDQARVAAVPFKVAIFTNLTRDHLDYHKTLEAYGKAKALLFAWQGLQVRVINKDDAFGQSLIDQKQPSKLLSYSLGDSSANLYCQDTEFGDHGVKAQLIVGKEQGLLESSLIGRFNLSNLLAVIGALIGLDYSLERILDILPKLKGPEGRMQRVGGGDKPLIVIDYAHTPDALEQVLTALRPHTTGRLICVFGCGGSRDMGKRPLMAAIAERIADHVVVTDDNPREEESKAIIDGILQGFEKPQSVLVIPERHQAIAQTIAQARQQDVVLIAGKGHENYQEVAGVRTPFSDLAETNQALDSWRKL